MNKIKPHLALLACNCIWAMDFPFYNLLLTRYMHPLALAEASLIATALISLVPLLWERAERVEKADIRKFFGAALLMGVFRKLFLMYGLSKTSPIDGSIIDTIVPILVLLLSVLLGLDRFTRLKVAGLLFGMAGAVAVVVTGRSSGHLHAQFAGNVLIFLCACVSSVYMVCFKKLVAKYRVTTVMRWLYCLAAVVMLPFGAGQLVHTDFGTMFRHAPVPTLCVFLLQTYLPNILFNYSLRFVSSTVSSIYTYLQPVVAIAASVALGLGRLHADTVVFALLIFLGVGMVLRAYALQSEREEPMKVNLH
ncbi:MAG: DMT family transporter [Alistipes sp.]|nr:DMT family transporter [Alistipes sp.]